ncbi:MAG: DNA replication and repair protein RecF [Candidatus Coatesbacteria bacterium]|nr:DNA replication and repair protein RecF [Candidatus Coatesbacteria bacterium]
MHIEHIFLKDFRNFEQLSLETSRQGAFFVGDNGAGKTNILESIYFASIFRSFRERQIRNLIKDRCEAFFIRIQGDFGDNRQIEIGIDRHFERNIKLDEVFVSKITEIVSVLKVIFLGPNDVNLLTGSPEKRRQQFDIFLSSNKEYIENLIKYQSVLKERNAYLKRKSIDRNLEDVQSEMLVDLAVPIWETRMSLIEDLRKPLTELAASLLSEDLDIEIRHKIGLQSELCNMENIREAYAESLKKSFEYDLNQGFTQYGPHRDDYEFLIGKKPLSIYGSQGQIRCVVTSLKIAFASIQDRKPILLLDEIFAELDYDRQNLLIEIVRDRYQCFFCSANLIPQLKIYPLFKVDKGEVSKID